MKKKLSITLSVILALTMALTLGACGKKDQAQSDGGNAKQATVSDSTSLTYEGTLLTAYEQKIVLAGDKGDMEFVTSDKTAYNTGEYDQMYLDDIVSVTYHKDKDGNHADKVILVEHMDTPLEFAGEVVDAGAYHLTLVDKDLSATFQIDADTYTVGQPSKGDKVELTYLGDLSEYPYANVVAVVEEAQEQPQTSTVRGVVSELTGNSILLGIDSAHAYRFNITSNTKVSGAAARINLGDTVDITFAGSIDQQPDAQSVNIISTTVKRTYVINGKIASVANNGVTVDTGVTKYVFGTTGSTKFYGEKPAEGYLTEVTYTGELGKSPVASIVYCAKSAKDANKTTAKKTEAKTAEAKKTDAKKAETKKPETKPTTKPTQDKKNDAAQKNSEPKLTPTSDKDNANNKNNSTTPENQNNEQEQGQEVEPTPNPEDQAEPTPNPEDQAEPTPSPEDQAEPTPNPEDQAEPTPNPEDQAEPTPEDEQDPAAEPAQDPAGTETEPEGDPATEPESEPEVEVQTNPDMGISGQGTIVNGDSNAKTIEIELKNGTKITLKYDDTTKISSGYIPQKGDVVKVEYGSTSLLLKDLQLISRSAPAEAAADQQEDMVAPQTPAAPAEEGIANAGTADQDEG